MKLGEVVIAVPTPKAPEPAKTSSSASTLERQQITQLPRGDTANVNEVLSTQPGLVYDALGNLYARGNHANIQYEIDGVTLPDTVSGLFGGFLSSKFIENMEVITGGLGAEYGDRLASVVNLNMRRPSEAGEGGARGLVRFVRDVQRNGLYGKRTGDLSVLGGGSYKRSNRALDPPAISPIISDTGDEERAFGRVDYDLSRSDHLSFVGNYSRNFYQIPIDPTLHPCIPTEPNCGRSPDQFGNPPPQLSCLDIVGALDMTGRTPSLLSNWSTSPSPANVPMRSWAPRPKAATGIMGEDRHPALPLDDAPGNGQAPLEHALMQQPAPVSLPDTTSSVANQGWPGAMRRMLKLFWIGLLFRWAAFFGFIVSVSNCPFVVDRAARRGSQPQAWRPVSWRGSAIAASGTHLGPSR